MATDLPKFCEFSWFFRISEVFLDRSQRSWWNSLSVLPKPLGQREGMVWSMVWCFQRMGRKSWRCRSIECELQRRWPLVDGMGGPCDALRFEKGLETKRWNVMKGLSFQNSFVCKFKQCWHIATKSKQMCWKDFQWIFGDVSVVLKETIRA